MAKPRKQKNGENQQQQHQPGGTRGGRFAEEWGTLLHQKLCLSVDMQRRRIYGHTEMKIVFPESGVVGLFADDMAIGSILVNGEPAEFEFYPHYHHVDDLKWDTVTCLNSAADTACSTYLSSLDKEMAPNLLISCPKIGSAVDNSVCPLNGADTSPKSPEKAEKSMKLVRINYCIETAKTGILFGDNILCTDNQIRRARCWFPCVDNSSQRCCYDLEFTVDMNFVAVSNGTLLYQILSSDVPPRKIYVYKLSVPVSASWVSLVVAPFDILPDSHNTIISHMCLPAKLAMLRSTVGFFHNAFSHYEDYLSMSFPFGSYKQVFVPPEMLSSSVNIAASMCTFSSEVLYDDKVIDETINTRVKLAYNLAKQWFGGYIAAESPSDEWLLDGLAGFLTDLFVRRSLGNNEARYRRYKANCTVCLADITGATSLSSSAASDLYGTQCIGLYGKIRSWKSVAILQMLEKQMGPDSFRKILQIIVRRAQDNTCSFQTLSTKEFRHLANKIGNLERPFLKEFFPRWVGSYGCPVLRLGLSYVKRKNMIELGVMRSSTAKTDSTSPNFTDNENQGVDASWPGMMSIRVHELDGMYDHPIFPMSGDTTQLLEIQLHSKLASKRVQKPKKGTKPDGSDDNNSDAAAVLDMRPSIESPLLWIRVDPEMEYLAEVHFHQPIQMWINQLEKDKDVVAQSEAILALKSLPQLPFSVINALHNFLNDSKAFWRIRVEAAFALAQTSSEDTDWAGLHHLVKFYKSQRFDADIGLPKPNNFHDIPEYFVLEVIPLALATIKTTDKKSPREVIEFILQLLKYNDNNGNPYSDVYWLATLVQSIGELEFGKQNIFFLPSLLKRIDRLLQFDRLMPSYNGILTVSCIHTLAQVALKMPKSVPLIHVFDHIKSFRNFGKWKIRIEANKSLMDLEFHMKGLDAALSLFLNFVEEESSYRGHMKLAAHALHLCEANINLSNSIRRSTLVSLLRLLASRKAFDNIYLRHYLFCILQIIAGRSPTLYGFSRAPLLHTMASEASNELKNKTDTLKKRISGNQENSMEPLFVNTPNFMPDGIPVTEVAKDADTISNSTERRVLKIRVKQPISGKADGVNNVESSRGWHDDTDLGPSSSVSVDAPQRPIIIETGSRSHQIIEEVNSRDHESRTTASVGSANLMIINEMAKELQCTADSRNGSLLPEDRSSPVFNQSDVEASAQKSSSLQSLSFKMPDEDKPSAVVDGLELKEREKKEKKEKKHKDKKRKRENEDRDRHNDPEYLERKRLKKEKKRMEKEHSKIVSGEALNASTEVENRPIAVCSKEISSVSAELSCPSMATSQENRNEHMAGIPSTKVRIKIKSRRLAD